MKQRGFSLWELLIGLAILGICCVVATPYLGATLGRVKLYVATHQLQQALQGARIAAIKAHAPVVVCPLLTTEQCGTNWSQGILLVSMVTKKRIKFYVNSDMHVTVRYQGFPTADKILVQPTGVFNQQNGTFTLVYQGFYATFSKKIIINHAGRVRVVE